MDSGDYPWTSRLFTSSKRYQSRSSDLYMGGDDAVEVEDDYKQEFLCPFCAEEFDVVGLCCHIDEEHPVELKQGVCPICAKRVGMDMVNHITLQHGNILKVQRRRRSRRIGSSSMLSIMKKELRDSKRQSLFDGHSYDFASSNVGSDPLLSSFVYSSPTVEESETLEADFSVESKSVELSADDNLVKRVEPLLTEKEQKEKSRKSEFVRGLLFSTILDDVL